MGPTATLQQVRALAIVAQGLERSFEAPLPALEATGFLRTLGGIDVYLASRARVESLSRVDIDCLVENHLAQVVPAARGCIYLVPGRHVAAALFLAELLSARRNQRDLEKVGIDQTELEGVGDAVLQVLADGPATTHELRSRVPEGTVRSLGKIGKKIGLSSNLPPTLRHLEFAGRLERTLAGGRLDTERYHWRLSESAPPEAESLTPAEVHRQMAEIFLQGAGAGSRRAFAAWSGLGQRDAAAAIAELDAVEVEVEGEKEPRYVLSHRLSELDSAPKRAAEVTAFLPFEDNLIALHGGPAIFADPSHHGVSVPVWGRGRGNTLGDVKHSTLRTVVAEGKLVGFWEFDPQLGEVVQGRFDAVSAATAERLDAEAAALGQFIRDELGHGRSFALDTDKSLHERAQLVRAI